MIHYHGTPVGGRREDVARFLAGRHALIPFPRAEDLATASIVCESFCVDNGAFSAWRSGSPVTDWTPYYEWVDGIKDDPAFDWAIIPDVIDGDEQANDSLIAEWPFGNAGVPVWHLHESLDRLESMSFDWPVVALGSSGEYRDPGSDKWWDRMDDALQVVCNERQQPRCKLHGLRMLDVSIFSRLPLKSADSTNAAVNGSRKAAQCGCNTLTGQTIIAGNIESHQASSRHCQREREAPLFL